MPGWQCGIEKTESHATPQVLKTAHQLSYGGQYAFNIEWRLFAAALMMLLAPDELETGDQEAAMLSLTYLHEPKEVALQKLTYLVNRLVQLIGH